MFLEKLTKLFSSAFHRRPRYITVSVDEALAISQPAKALPPSRLPRHVAIIMDGNGRWAQARGMSRSAGHAAGTEALRDSVGSLIFWLEQIPVFSIFSQDSFYLFWVPAFSFYCFRKKKLKKRLVLLVPFGANLLFLVFAPVCVTRYGLCQLFTFPMLLAITAMPIGKEETVDSASLLQDLLQNATMLLMGKESASGQGTS